MKNNDTGILLNDQNIKLHRQWFKQMTKLIGLNVIYQAPKDTDPNIKTYNRYGELDPEYEEGIVVGCIFDEHPTQKTMRKLGWNAEMADTSTVIHVPYDLPNVAAHVVWHLLRPNNAHILLPGGVQRCLVGLVQCLQLGQLARQVLDHAQQRLTGGREALNELQLRH